MLSGLCWAAGHATASNSALQASMLRPGNSVSTAATISSQTVSTPTSVAATSAGGGGGAACTRVGAPPASGPAAGAPSAMLLLKVEVATGGDDDLSQFQQSINCATAAQHSAALGLLGCAPPSPWSQLQTAAADSGSSGQCCPWIVLPGLSYHCPTASQGLTGPSVLIERCGGCSPTARLIAVHYQVVSCMWRHTWEGPRPCPPGQAPLPHSSPDTCHVRLHKWETRMGYMGFFGKEDETSEPRQWTSHHLLASLPGPA